MGTDKAKPAKKATEELNVDDFLNGGFMSVASQQDQLSDSADSEEDDAHAADMGGDAEQDAHGLTSAAADEASESDSDGTRVQSITALHQS